MEICVKSVLQAPGHLVISNDKKIHLGQTKVVSNFSKTCKAYWDTFQQHCTNLAKRIISLLTVGNFSTTFFQSFKSFGDCIWVLVEPLSKLTKTPAALIPARVKIAELVVGIVLYPVNLVFLVAEAIFKFINLRIVFKRSNQLAVETFKVVLKHKAEKIKLSELHLSPAAINYLGLGEFKPEQELSTKLLTNALRKHPDVQKYLAETLDVSILYSEFKNACVSLFNTFVSIANLFMQWPMYLFPALFANKWVSLFCAPFAIYFLQKDFRFFIEDVAKVANSYKVKANLQKALKEAQKAGDLEKTQHLQDAAGQLEITNVYKDCNVLNARYYFISAFAWIFTAMSNSASFLAKGVWILLLLDCTVGCFIGVLQYFIAYFNKHKFNKEMDAIAANKQSLLEEVFNNYILEDEAAKLTLEQKEALMKKLLALFNCLGLKKAVLIDLQVKLDFVKDKVENAKKEKAEKLAKEVSKDGTPAVVCLDAKEKEAFKQQYYGIIKNAMSADQCNGFNYGRVYIGLNKYILFAIIDIFIPYVGGKIVDWLMKYYYK